MQINELEIGAERAHDIEVGPRDQFLEANSDEADKPVVDVLDEPTMKAAAAEVGLTAVKDCLDGSDRVSETTPPPRKKTGRSHTLSRTRQTRGRSSIESNDPEDLTRTYLEDIGRVPLLTKDDEVKLAQAIEAGVKAQERLDVGSRLSTTQRRKLHREVRQGEEAHREFVNSNLRLVVSIAKKYQGKGLPLLDVVQEGNLGLVHAVDKFDWRRGFKFSTYATWWVRQAIQRGIAYQARTIRLPNRAGDLATKVLRELTDYEIEHGKKPLIEELAERCDENVKNVLEILNFLFAPESLDEPIGEKGDTEMGDMVHDRNAPNVTEQAETNDIAVQIRNALEALDPHERQVLTLHFGLDRGGEPRKLDEVAKETGLSREYVTQTKRKAIAKLRHPSMEEYGLRSLLG